MNRISELRKKLGLTQTRLGEEIGVSQQTISKYEKVDENISGDMLLALSKFFKVPVDYILRKDEEEQQREQDNKREIMELYRDMDQYNRDSGVTGRKIIVDTYGGMARHGGGAFSGKDCTKVDRSASYAARYVAKNIVAAGLAKKCEIQLSYAIGVAHPTSIMVDTFGTGKISDESLVDMIRKEFDLRPAGIIQTLNLRRPIYKQTAAYGHFGRNDLNLPWERLDKVEELKKYLK